MTPERWQQIRDLLDRAMQLGLEQRAALLDRSCDSDPSLRQEVESLLASGDEVSSSFLELPASFPQDSAGKNDPGLAAIPSVEGSETPYMVIGRYQLVHRIGEGGMGEVWLAEQKEPVRRRVALKLIKSGLNRPEAMLRFDSERQALAEMDHPAIAKVFDAGATPQGAPYFVMEYVAGIPITDYCDMYGLPVSERLKLFIHVCEGVQHAHQNAIIHRDLKPSNILVADVDGQAVPKIIDFGIAKALTQRLTAETVFTHTGDLIGTPEYMSPEQAGSAGENIDTRTDVYSLGIILYELLAGEPPINLRKIAFEEFLRRLREDDPPKPSTRVSTQDSATSTEVARKRQTEPHALARQLHGELDSISLRALEKERARRYASASEFASDIRRYLNHEAVLAVPPSLAYRARKFVRRYRAVLSTASVFGLLLVAAAVVSIRQSIRANREAAVAAKEAAMAEAVNDFLQNDLLTQAGVSFQTGPDGKPDPHLEVRTALDRAATRIEAKFAKQPEVEAAIRSTVGWTYADLGLLPEARKQLERALELRRRVLGEEHVKTLKSMQRLGWIAYNQGKYAEAEALESHASELQRHILGPDHADTLASIYYLAAVYLAEGKYARAEALHLQVLQSRKRAFGPENRDTLASMVALAVVYHDEGKDAQAEPVAVQALEIMKRVLGPEHPETLICMDNLGVIYDSEGKYSQGEALELQLLDVEKRIYSPDHPRKLDSMNNLANLYIHEGKYAQAESLYSQALDIVTRVLGPDHPETLISMLNMAVAYDNLGKYSQAQSMNVRALEISKRVLGPNHAYTLVAMDNLALVYDHEGGYAQAEALLTQTLEMRRRVLGPEHPDTLETLSGFASLYQRQGKYSLAETYATQALDGRRHVLGLEHPDTMASAADLVLAYLSQGKFTESEPLAREALDFNRKNQQEDWQRFRAESLLGASLAGQKKYAEAEPLLLSGYQGMAARKGRIDVPDWYHLDRAREWIVQLYQAWGKPAKAAEWRKK
jgi:eukaryotic-like serine/threonine-protein kinase